MRRPCKSFSRGAGVALRFSDEISSPLACASRGRSPLVREGAATMAGVVTTPGLLSHARPPSLTMLTPLPRPTRNSAGVREARGAADSYRFGHELASCKSPSPHPVRTTIQQTQRIISKRVLEDEIGTLGWLERKPISMVSSRIRNASFPLHVQRKDRTPNF